MFEDYQPNQIDINRPVRKTMALKALKHCKYQCFRLFVLAMERDKREIAGIYNASCHHFSKHYQNQFSQFHRRSCFLKGCQRTLPLSGFLGKARKNIANSDGSGSTCCQHRPQTAQVNQWNQITPTTTFIVGSFRPHFQTRNCSKPRFIHQCQALFCSSPMIYIWEHM